MSSMMLKSSTYATGAGIASHVVSKEKGVFMLTEVPKLMAGGKGVAKLGILAANKAFVEELNNHHL